MGEAASSWKLPLHSSDTEHPWQKRVAKKGMDHLVLSQEGGAFPAVKQGDPISGLSGPGTNASSVLTNPFDKRST
jgi:hypothetical protein